MGIVTNYMDNANWVANYFAFGSHDILFSDWFRLAYFFFSHQVWWRICKESTPTISSWALMVNPPLWAGNTSAEQYPFLHTATTLVFHAISLYTYTLSFCSPLATSSASQGGHAFTSTSSGLTCSARLLFSTSPTNLLYFLLVCVVVSLIRCCSAHTVIDCIEMLLK